MQHGAYLNLKKMKGQHLPQFFQKKEHDLKLPLIYKKPTYEKSGENHTLSI